MIRDNILKYLYDTNARCDIKLEDVADDISSMICGDLLEWSNSLFENGMYREAEYLNYLSKVI